MCCSHDMSGTVQCYVMCCSHDMSVTVQRYIMCNPHNMSGTVQCCVMCCPHNMSGTVQCYVMCCPHNMSVTVQRYVMCSPNTVTAVPCTVHSLTCVTSQCYLRHQTSNTVHTLYVRYCSVLCSVLSTHFTSVTVLRYVMYCPRTLCLLLF